MSLLHRTREHAPVDAAHDDTVVAERLRHNEHDTAPTAGGAAAIGAREDAPDDRVTKTRERTWTFAPGQLVSFAVGLGLIAVGLLAVIRAGLDGDLADPTVDVLRLSHTAWLGLAEIGLGVLLLVAGTGAWGRFLSVPTGALMVVAGILVVAEPSEMPDELALARDHGWALLLLGALVALAAMVLPVWRTRRVNEIDLRDTHEHTPR